MNYNETLLRYVKESKLTLREIARLCKEEHNVKINPSYISKLTSGNHPPASDEVNEAIAKVTKNDYEELYFAAYLSKAPDSVKQLIEKMVNYLKDFTGAYMKSQVKKELMPIIDKTLNEYSDWKIIKGLLDSEPVLPDNNKLFVRSQTPEMKGLLALISPITGVAMPDNSMEPLIPKGALIQQDFKSDIEENNVVIARQKDTNIMFVRRYIKNGAKGLLIADNPKFKPIHIGGDSNVVLVCKVKSYVREL